MAPPAPQAPQAPQAAELAHLARLGAALARPFGTFDQRAWSIGPLSPAEIAALGREPSFARPVGRAVAAKMLAPGFGFSREEARRLAATPDGRLAILLVSEPAARVEEAALLCAAAAMQRQVLAVTTKAERQRLRRVLGPAACDLATQEAPMLYPGLAALGDAALFHAAASEADEARARRLLADFGLGLLLRLASAAAPAIAALVAARLPADARAVEARAGGAAGIRQFTRLFHRRIPAWSAIIG